MTAAGERQPAYTDADKADAVATYIEHGLAEAHHRTGIPKGTLRRWAISAGHDPAELSRRATDKTRAATETNLARWAELRTTMADRYGDIAARLLDQCGDYLEDLVPTDPKDLKDLATTAAIMTDKAELLAGHATSRHEMLQADRDAVVDDARDRGLRLVSNG